MDKLDKPQINKADKPNNKPNNKPHSKLGDKPKISLKDKTANGDFYSCLCGFKTKSLAEFRRHLGLSMTEHGKHKSLGTKPAQPLDITHRGSGKKKQERQQVKGKQGESVTVLPSGETVGGYDEIKKPQLTTAPELSGATKEDKEKEKEKAEFITTEIRQGEVVLQQKGEERWWEKIPPIPAEIIGFGIPISVMISVKSLALYQIARALSGNSLELGNFVDDCIEDAFQGRGQDLGLTKTKV